MTIRKEDADESQRKGDLEIDWSLIEFSSRLFGRFYCFLFWCHLRAKPKDVRCKTCSFVHLSFLVACTRLCNPLRWSVGPSVGNNVWFIPFLWLSGNTAPAQSHATVQMCIRHCFWAKICETCSYVCKLCMPVRLQVFLRQNSCSIVCTPVCRLQYGLSQETWNMLVCLHVCAYACAYACASACAYACASACSF